MMLAVTLNFCHQESYVFIRGAMMISINTYKWILMMSSYLLMFCAGFELFSLLTDLLQARGVE